MLRKNLIGKVILSFFAFLVFSGSVRAQETGSFKYLDDKYPDVKIAVDLPEKIQAITINTWHSPSCAMQR